MRITCPTCEATYDVPEKLLRPDREVRCARCGGRWLPAPAEPGSPSPEAPEPPATDDITAPPAPAGERPPSFDIFNRTGDLADHGTDDPGARSGQAVWAAWAASLLILAGLGWAGLTYRAQVMHVWPPTERLYALFGLAGDSRSP